MAVAAVYGVERVVILGAGLVLVTGDFERRVDEKVVRGRDGIVHGGEVSWDAVGFLSVDNFVLLRDFRDLREVAVGIGDKINVGDDGERPVSALVESGEPECGWWLWSPRCSTASRFPHQSLR